MQESRECVVGGLSIVFPCNAVDEAFNRKSTNIFKSCVKIDASQLYPYWMCRLMPARFFTRCSLVSKTSRFTPWQEEAEAFQIKWRSVSNVPGEIVKMNASGKEVEKSLLQCWWTLFSLQTVFEAMGSFCLFRLLQEVRPSLLEVDIQRGSKNRELDGLRQSFKREKPSLSLS